MALEGVLHLWSSALRLWPSKESSTCGRASSAVAGSELLTKKRRTGGPWITGDLFQKKGLAEARTRSKWAIYARRKPYLHDN